MPEPPPSSRYLQPLERKLVSATLSVCFNISHIYTHNAASYFWHLYTRVHTRLCETTHSKRVVQNKCCTHATTHGARSTNESCPPLLRSATAFAFRALALYYYHAQMPQNTKMEAKLRAGPCLGMPRMGAGRQPLQQRLWLPCKWIDTRAYLRKGRNSFTHSSTPASGSEAWVGPLCAVGIALGLVCAIVLLPFHHRQALCALLVWAGNWDLPFDLDRFRT